jgi:hypothetical protein
MTKALLEPRELIAKHELAGDTFQVLQLTEGYFPRVLFGCGNV